MIYLDSSCLLKLLLDEPGSEAVRQAVAREGHVVVSALTELETTVQLGAAWRGGRIRAGRHRAYLAQLEAFRDIDPFRFVPLSGAVFQSAVHQHRAGQVHCRTLDRLHLAAMDELGVRRLLTDDRVLARGAAALGFEVMHPRRP